jgi:hypothetical protein
MGHHNGQLADCRPSVNALQENSGALTSRNVDGTAKTDKACAASESEAEEGAMTRRINVHSTW